jgi:hypothetical protein
MERRVGREHNLLRRLAGQTLLIVEVIYLDSTYVHFLHRRLADSTKVLHTCAEGEYIAKSA